MKYALHPIRLRDLFLSLLLLPWLGLAETNTSSAGRINFSFDATTANSEKTKVPALYAVDIASSITLTATTVTHQASLNFRMLQGESERLLIDLNGACNVISVTGKGLLGWAVLQSGTAVKGAPPAQRQLELRFKKQAAAKSGTKAGTAVQAKAYQVAVVLKQTDFSLPVKSLRLATFGPAKAIGFQAQIDLKPHTDLRMKIVSAKGLSGLSDATVDPKTGKSKSENQSFQTSSASDLRVSLTEADRFLQAISFHDLALDGEVKPEEDSVRFALTGKVLVTSDEEHEIPLLSQAVALAEIPKQDGIEVFVRDESYWLRSNKAGTYPIALTLYAKLVVSKGERQISFSLPAGTVVPIRLAGIAEAVGFDASADVVPRWTGKNWQGFLPADGMCRTRWTPIKANDAQGALFFTSFTQTDIQVGAGVMRQASSLELSVLQGQLTEINVGLEGMGSILSVSGVLSWKEVKTPAGRTLALVLAQPLKGKGSIGITSQKPMENLPTELEPLRLIPEKTVRHSGRIRVMNQGEVRLTVKDIVGMTQLSPDKYMAGLPKVLRQLMVYQFPSAEHGFKIKADTIIPEVDVSQITTYHLGEADRIVTSDIELDITEAAIREFALTIPADFSVAEVLGAAVGDHSFDTEKRRLVLLFSQPVMGRQLIQLRLERTENASGGTWELPKISMPDAKSIRGHIGVSAAPGYRIEPATIDGVAEVPLAYFPKRSHALQQAFRIKQADWSISLTIESLGQHIDADVFHLYSLKEGVAYGSVLLNAFIVGSPMSQWEVHVPTNLGHIAVDGDDVRSWQRDGETIKIDLNQPALGAHTLLITFEQPMSSGQGELEIGQIYPLNVQSERGMIQVTSPQQLKHQIKEISDDVIRMEYLELPPEFRILSQSPSLGVFQYTERPFKIVMAVDWLTPGETVDQLVDFAYLQSAVARDGQTITRAKLFVKSRGRKVLRMKIPKSMTLWGVAVAGEAKSARSDGEDTLIPIPTHVDPNMPIEVTFRMLVR